MASAGNRVIKGDYISYIVSCGIDGIHLCDWGKDIPLGKHNIENYQVLTEGTKEKWYKCSFKSRSWSIFAWSCRFTCRSKCQK